MKYAGLFVGLWMLVGLGLHTGVLSVAYDHLAQTASVFFIDSSTPQKLLAKYAAAKRGGEAFKILIVPGHDDVSSGASFGGLREADLALGVATRLAKELEANEHIEARLVRTEAGYDPDLARYFFEQRQDIFDYRASQTAQMRAHLASGAIESNIIVGHNFAPSEVAIKLYGINKWANEQGYDLVIHMHFNDVPRFDRSRPGWPTGFALYVPERQFSNAKGSMAVAEAIQGRLLELYKVSSLPAESGTPIEDQELIAIGSNNSLDASSILIEYSYIYEPVVQDPLLREGSLDQMAKQTYLGIEDFLHPASSR